MMRRRTMGALVAVILAGAMLAGCGGGVDDEFRDGAIAVVRAMNDAVVAGRDLTPQESDMIASFGKTYDGKDMSDEQQALYKSLIDVYVTYGEYDYARITKTKGTTKDEMKSKLAEFAEKLE